ncbi:LmeA family phospholipid-binding protein [Streptomyces sp. H27-D2]|uniref:LmeA family phospholipid-binding protein n=1 Tax=Streptomyces sp. H27-D2 TaxID=3046304 RepID=UPI002DBD30B2|nr:LmeA family phospholipid-binding protein [Streptomyces sp. H27-D2]MEC4015659.1 LmeA family phospholipid-binding protein [Streptomyces sp. H27-D2]
MRPPTRIPSHAPRSPLGPDDGQPAVRPNDARSAMPRPDDTLPGDGSGGIPHAHPQDGSQDAPREHPYSRPATHNPYDALAALADPEPVPGTEPAADDNNDPLGLGLRSDEDDEEPWERPNHRRMRRGRSRFAAVPITVKAVGAVLIGAAFLGLADRWAVLYAEQKTQEKVQDSLHLTAAPEVTIHGFPFLTQVFDKRLEKVDVTIPDVAANRVSLAKVEATADDIRITGSLPNSINGAVVSRMHGNVLLAFDDLNRELGASQVKFSENGRNSVRASGHLPIAGHDLKVRAEARIRRVGSQGIATSISGMRLDIADLASYEPGPGGGLRLSRKTAEQVSREAAKAKALFAVPAVAKRLGVPPGAVEQAKHSEKKLHELTGAPRFVDKLMKLNLVDVVIDHPWLLEKIGIDPGLVKTLTGLKQPELADRLSLSFQLPDIPGYVRLQHITVEREGIRADLTGMDLPFGDAAKDDAKKK